jgi:fumarate hydratase class II
MPLEIVYSMATLKKCCALYNSTKGKLSKDKAKAIMEAADEVIKGEWDEQFPLVIYQTGSGTQTNMNINEVLSNLAILKLGGEVRAG